MSLKYLDLRLKEEHITMPCEISSLNNRGSISTYQLYLKLFSQYCNIDPKRKYDLRTKTASDYTRQTHQLPSTST